MKFSEFSTMIDGCMVLEEGLALWNIGPQSPPCLLTSDDSSINVHLLVLEGSLEALFAGRHHHVAAGCFANFIDQPQLELLDYSADVRAYAVYSTERYVSLLFKNSPPPFPFSYIVRIKEHPVFSLMAPDLRRFLLRMKSLSESMRNESHCFRYEMVRHAFWMYLVDVADMYIHQRGVEEEIVKSDGKRSIFLRFMKLLHSHVSASRQVGFYASELCITPQYLNRVVRFCSGKTSYHWISFTLLGEIIQRLECSNDSIGQIAEELNFPDQSALTNFFKRQLGVSPTEYRRTHSLISPR